jgi:DNA polymerase-3 subunit epsilon
LAGHKIDDAAVTAFVDHAVIVIAHKSGFDIMVLVRLRA